MWEKLSYRQKNKLLLAGTLLLLVLCYSLAFNKTIALYQENAVMETKLAALKTAPQQMAGLNKQLQFLNSRVEQYVRDEHFDQEDVLVAVSDFCKDHRLTLVDFPQSTQKQKEDVFIETFHFAVEGSFTQLVRLLYFMEYEEKIGRIASVAFSIETDRRTKARRLVVRVHLQNLREYEKN